MTSRAGAVRRGVQLLGLAVGPRRHADAGGAGAAGGQRGGVLPAATASAEDEVAGRGAARWAWACCPGHRSGRGVLTGQVPARDAGRLAGGVPRARRLRRALPGRRLARRSSTPWPSPPAASGCQPAEVALAWVRDRPGVVAPIVGARTTAQLRTALASEERRAARRAGAGAGRRLGRAGSGPTGPDLRAGARLRRGRPVRRRPRRGWRRRRPRRRTPRRPARGRRRRRPRRRARPARRPRRRSVEVVVLVVLVVVIAVDLQRGDLAVGVEQRVVVGVESLGDVLVGGEHRRVVLAAA